MSNLNDDDQSNKKQTKIIVTGIAVLKRDALITCV